MNIKSIIKNLFIAFFSQGVSLLASFLTTLILPKLVSVSDYGLWQLFIFYTTYAGVFHLGLDDGVYLKLLFPLLYILYFWEQIIAIRMC